MSIGSCGEEEGVGNRGEGHCAYIVPLSVCVLGTIHNLSGALSASIGGWRGLWHGKSGTCAACSAGALVAVAL
jgi:hypothetical protein